MWTLRYKICISQSVLYQILPRRLPSPFSWVPEWCYATPPLPTTLPFISKLPASIYTPDQREKLSENVLHSSEYMKVHIFELRRMIWNCDDQSFHKNVLLNTESRKARVVSKGQISLSVRGPGFKSDRVHFERTGRDAINTVSGFSEVNIMAWMQTSDLSEKSTAQTIRPSHLLEWYCLCSVAYIRVRTGHGKPGKSWNLWISFPGLESHGI